MPLRRLLLSMIALSGPALLVACGGGGESSGDSDSAGPAAGSAKGYFIDSPVSGLDYSSTSFSGVTGGAGDFEFAAGETTTFSYLGLTIGSVSTTENSTVVTPLDLANTTDTSNQTVKNILVFLQSLDGDQNPSNQLSLRRPSTDTASEYPDLSGLDLSSSTFQSDLQSALQGASATNGITLVNEADAVAHFESTLEDLGGSPSLVGQWILRSGQHGDVSARYDFNANQGLTVTEYEGCPGTFWAATEASTQRNCPGREQLSLSWALSGDSLSMESSEVSDTCTIISSNFVRMTANCRFQGSGQGEELVYFDRVINGFSSDLIQPTYREIAEDALSYTRIRYASDNTGDYTFFNSSGVAGTGPGDQGDFTWSVSSSQLQYSGTDNSSQSFAGSFDFVAEVDGALKVVRNADGQSSPSVLIPDFDPNLAAAFGGQAFYGVYDATEGNCKAVYEFVSDNGQGQREIRKRETTSQNPDQCSFSLSDNSAQESAEVKSLTIQNGAFVMEGNGSNEICWPIRYTNGTAGTYYMSVACSSTDSAGIQLEIWYSL